VVPGEILHADYAAPVIEYLVRRFSTTRLTVAPVARFGSAVQRTVVEV